MCTIPSKGSRAQIEGRFCQKAFNFPIEGKTTLIEGTLSVNHAKVGNTHMPVEVTSFQKEGVPSHRGRDGFIIDGLWIVRFRLAFNEKVVGETLAT